MTKLVKLTGYHFTILSRSVRVWVLLIIWLSYIFFVYRNEQSEIVSIFISSSIFLFYIMLVMAIMYYDLESESARNIMALCANSKNMYLYHFSELLSLWIYGSIMGGLGVLIPLVFDRFIKNIFENNLLKNEIIMAAIVMIMFAVLGASVGALFHPTIFTNRLISITFVILLSIATLTKQGIVRDRPVLKYVMWFVPPLSDILAIFEHKKQFEMDDVIQTSMYIGVYFFVFTLINLFVLRKKKF